MVDRSSSLHYRANLVFSNSMAGFCQSKILEDNRFPQSPKTSRKQIEPLYWIYSRQIEFSPHILQRTSCPRLFLTTYLLVELKASTFCFTISWSIVARHSSPGGQFGIAKTFSRIKWKESTSINCLSLMSDWIWYLNQNFYATYLYPERLAVDLQPGRILLAPEVSFGHALVWVDTVGKSKKRMHITKLTIRMNQRHSDNVMNGGETWYRCPFAAFEVWHCYLPLVDLSDYSDFYPCSGWVFRWNFVVLSIKKIKIKFKY